MMQNTDKVVEVEIWRDIAGFEGQYQVSSRGRVKSLDRVINTSNGRQRRLIGHLLQPHDNGIGYQQVNLYDESHKLHAKLVHRLVLTSFMNLSDDDLKSLSLEVNHVNSDPYNNALSNLNLVTHQQNLNQEHRMNLISRACVALTPDGEITLKAKSIKEMALLMGVSKDTISKRLKSGKELNGLTIKEAA
ncbi:NUMOD4 domain-containing protein [Lactiplantibacillus plantarum]|uniref:NUMOD4 domain-containing protein n=1 Tax=Lactiplantibacillus plantarum TaxID=1590 RepID=UPI0007B5526F|nr:NUMOD4 domain-containing protein [Lactiplantibacillus plantarum]